MNAKHIKNTDIFRSIFCLGILSAKMLFCADPYEQTRMELRSYMNSEDLEKIIQEDEKVRKALTSNRLPEQKIRVPAPKPMTPEERKAFQQQMAARARNAQFGNLGK